MTRPPRGLYETLISEGLERELSAIGSTHPIDRKDLRAAEAADRFALHVSEVLRRALADMPDHERVTIGNALVRRLIEQIALDTGDAELRADAPVDPARVLSAILTRNADGTERTIDAPLIPLLDTTLLTNAPGEPRVGSQLLWTQR